MNFEVKKGEILGIGGLVGSQRSELIEAIFGLHPITSGKIFIKGREAKINNPKDAIANGIALLTEDRRKTGIIGPMSITDNILAVSQNTNLKKYTKYRIYFKQ